jgi:transcriptional regulator with XRE-family HTH domain
VLAEEWKRIVLNLASTVKQLRILLGWSQQKLADRSVTSQGLISRMESGQAADIPFHSVVVVIRTLAMGLAAIEVPLSPSAMALIEFCQANRAFITASPPDPDLVTVARILNRLPSKQRKAFVQLAKAAAELVSVTDNSPPVSSELWHG